MRSLALLFMITAALSSCAVAHSLVGVWRLVEVNALGMQDTPPYGQINRKEVYTDDGRLLVARPDAPFAEARTMGTYEVQDSVRVFNSPEGETVATPIQWIDADHFFFEFNPGERWYYSRVTGPDAQNAEWEPRSVAVIRVSEEDGPTLRDFPYDVSDDSAMRWEKRLVGAWETIRVGGRAVSGPDTPPYGMPNDRFLIGADQTLRKVRANNEADGEAVHFTVAGSKLTLVEAQVDLAFWFNRWGQLVLEQPGMQTILKRISLDPAKAPAGPFVVVLLSGDREEPKAGGKIVEVPKSAVPVAKSESQAKAPAAAAKAAGKPKATFRQPYNGGSRAADLALAGDGESLEAGHAVNRRAKTQGLGTAAQVEEIDTDEKFAVVRSAALKATIEVPLGWHVTDDGARTLVFDADQFIRLQLDQREATHGPKALLQEVLAARKARQPDVKAQLMDNADGSALLIVQNWTDDEGTGTRSFVAREGLIENHVLVAEIATVSPADLVRGLNLSEVVLRHLKP